jgi:hypothetical protein
MKVLFAEDSMGGGCITFSKGGFGLDLCIPFQNITVAV